MVRIYQTPSGVYGTRSLRTCCWHHLHSESSPASAPRLCFPHRSREKQVIQVAKLFFPHILQARNDNKMLFSFGWSCKLRGLGVPLGEESSMAEENEINQQGKRKKWRGESPGKYSNPWICSRRPAPLFFYGCVMWANHFLFESP